MRLQVVGASLEIVRHLLPLFALYLGMLVVFPLIASNTSRIKMRRIVVALVVAVLLAFAAATVHAEDEATGDAIVRTKCGSKLLLEWFWICT